MKFALIATIAAVSAIKVKVEDCIKTKEAHAIFEAIDTNHNEKMSLTELIDALKKFARSRDYTPSDEDWAWVEKKYKLDAGSDKLLEEGEFHEWINQFASRNHIDGCN
tara:strand:+ start:176 stop:499 length:324 start_codon:yes stop_codon:yes gene_type:complete